MRTISAGDEQLLTATGATARRLVRVQVKDSGGTWRDLSTYPEQNFVRSANWGESVDDNGARATIRLRRGIEKLSLAPELRASPLNHGFDPAASYAALLAPNREVKIEWAICPELAEPTSWNLGFHGYINRVSWPAGDVVLECSGLEKKLRNAWIEKERVYAYAQGVSATKGCYVFEPSTAYALNDLVIPTQSRLNGHFYKVTTAGTTAATEPSWPTGGGSTVTSGTATFTEVGSASTSTGTAVETVMQQIIDDTLGGGVVTLYTPSSPSWNIRWYKQRRESVLSALRTLVDQIGWDLRYKWDNGTSALRFTFAAPDRTKVALDRTFAAADVLDVSSLETHDEDVRNAIELWWSDSQDLSASGRPKRKSVLRTDSTSISSYDRRYMEVAEADTSNIDSSSEAQAMADAILADLKDPLLDMGPELRFFPWAQLGDLYRIPADFVRFDNAQDLAVVGYQHSVDEAVARTSLSVRGKPSSGVNRWLKKDARVRTSHAAVALAGAGPTVTTADVVGGTRISIAETRAKFAAADVEYEIHVSPTAAFTPSSTTLISSGKKIDVTVSDLVPGKTYYLQVVPYSFNASKIVRGMPTVETSFVAAKARAAHVDTDCDTSKQPLNGGFEHQFQASNDAPPDGWTMTAGTWKTDIQVNEDTSGISGKRYLEVRAGTTQRTLESAYFDVVAGHLYSIRAIARGVSGASGNLNIEVQWYTQAKATESSATAMQFDCTATTYAEKHYAAQAPSNARFGKVRITKATATDNSAWYVDHIRVVDDGEAWHDVDTTGEPAFQNSWANYDTTNWERAAFRKSPDGIVEVRGLIKDGTTTAGTTIFTLPAGYRPRKALTFPLIIYNNTIGRISIDTSGNVNTDTVSATWTSLTGISFHGDA